MNKIFKCEEGNVLRLVMEEPVVGGSHYWPTDQHFYDAHDDWFNRESYPYVAPDWKVGDLIPETSFRVIEQWYDDENKMWVDMFPVERKYLNGQKTRQFAYPISKPKKED